MSWQATAWAARQTTGSASNKLTLLALANYADASGICWPTQETLAKDTEQSIDTVQRRLKKLVALGLVRVEKRAGGRGQWDGRVYYLAMSVAEMTEPQSAARSHPVNVTALKGQTGERHAAPGPATMPHQARPPYRTAVRHKPSIEHPIEPSAQKSTQATGERLRAFQGKCEPAEVIQHRIARRLGSDGWLVLGEMSDEQLAKLTTLERRGKLDDNTLAAAALQARKHQLHANGGAP